MWSPVKIKFTNLYSHANSEYEFKTGVCTVIHGENRTDKSAENNGSGKSTLFEAIDIALTGRSSRGVDKESFINNDADACEINFTLQNPFLKMELGIVRRFYRGSKSSQIEIWENGEWNRQLVNVAAANKHIYELLGLTEQDLSRYYIISQDSRFTFFTANDADKKEILNRITSADIITPAIDELVARRKTKAGQLQESEGRVNRIRGKIEVLDGQLERWEEEGDDYTEEIARLQEQIVEAAAQTKELDKSITVAAKETAVAQKAFNDLMVDKVETRVLRAQKDEKQDEIDECRKTLATLDVLLQGEIECPECGYKFINDGNGVDLTPAEARKLRSAAAIELNNLKIERNDIEAQIAKSLEWDAKVDDARTALEKAKRRQVSLQRDKDDAQDQTRRWNERINKLEQERADDSRRTALVKEQQLLSEQLKSAEQTLETDTQELEMIRFWEYHMGRTGFTTFVANKSVKHIEGLTNSFLKRFGNEMQVLINGFTVLKDGTVRDKIETFIQMDGLTAQPFAAKSGGERARVQLAGILALQQLINMSCKGRGLAFVAFDETFAGIDSAGTREIIKILEGLGTTVMMITQNIEDTSTLSAGINILKVVKEDGVSKYV